MAGDWILGHSHWGKTESSPGAHHNFTPRNVPTKYHKCVKSKYSCSWCSSQGGPVLLQHSLDAIPLHLHSLTWGPARLVHPRNESRQNCARAGSKLPEHELWIPPRAVVRINRYDVFSGNHQGPNTKNVRSRRWWCPHSLQRGDLPPPFPPHPPLLLFFLPSLPPEF